MKTVIAVLVLLVIIGAVVFAFGWIQLKLDEDSYAVIFSKTGGWEDDVIRPGEFTWRAERLLPTNVSLHTFKIRPHVFSTTLRGSLPGATTYATLLDSPGAFSYAVTVDIAYQIDPDALPRMAQSDGLRGDGLDDYYDLVDARMLQLVNEEITRNFTSPDNLVTPASASATLSENVHSALVRAFRVLQIISVGVSRLDLPDIELYTTARDRYLQVLETRAASLEAAAAARATETSAIEAGLERLARYGEILSEYPVLLDYFTLSQELPGDPLDLESLIPAQTE